MKSNLQVLIAKKAQRERRRLTLRSVARELGATPSTVYRLAHNELREIPVEFIERLCHYLDCELADLLVLEDAPASPPDQA